MKAMVRFFLLMFLCSCTVNEQDADLGYEGFYQVQGTGYQFTLNRVKYQELDFNRKAAASCPVDFELKGIKRQGNELSLEIERPKGCAGSYELVWDGVWQESSPRRMQIYLTANFPGCSVGTETEVDVVQVDLAKALLEGPKDLFTIYLREHCSFRDFNCTGNCDLSI